MLARDRLGLKPLYIYRDAEKLVFGSEIKAILACPAWRAPSTPPRWRTTWPTGWSPAPRTIFQAIEKLPPAHVLAVRPDDLTAPARRYWRLRIEPDPGPTAEEWQEAIRAKLAETTRLHLIADVPVGAFLSGGIDSSLIVALTRRRDRGRRCGPSRWGSPRSGSASCRSPARSPTGSAPSTPRRSSRPTP